jgi:hypothetical protein
VTTTRHIAILFALAAAATAQQHTPVKLESPVQDKNFYLLSLLERSSAVRSALQADPVLAHFALDSATFQWNETQIAEASHALASLYRNSAAVKTLVDGPLRDSGMYVRYNNLDGAAFLERAWQDCIHGINHAIDVYGLGKPPRYPSIDAITYDASSDSWKNIVRNLGLAIQDDPAKVALYFQPSLRFALERMLFNQRDEAGRLEPMESGVNADAWKRMKSVDWKRYPYSAIVVPGEGNDRPGVALSPGGKVRDDIAAKRFHDGKAPFVLVSGGFVHPAHTEFSEAIEMKRDLASRLGVPANAIIVDPHARHTTTNIRNAARLLYRYGAPFDKKALVSSDPQQSTYIEGEGFAKRCVDELGYVPYKLLGRTSPFDLEFLPAADSLQSDPGDLLDP